MDAFQPEESYFRVAPSRNEANGMLSPVDYEQAHTPAAAAA